MRKAAWKKVVVWGSTCDRSDRDCSIFQLYLHRLVRELHQEPARLDSA